MLQVDVRALKQTLWQVLGEQHDRAVSSGAPADSLSFQDVLASLTPEKTASPLPDLSVHLCFICLLHLANENGLCITGAPTLDEMSIGNLPRFSTV